MALTTDSGRWRKQAADEIMERGRGQDLSDGLTKLGVSALAWIYPDADFSISLWIATFFGHWRPRETKEDNDACRRIFAMK